MRGSATSSTSRFHWPRRTVRMQLTVLYVALFLASGTLLIAITNVGARSDSTPFPKFGPDIGERVVTPGIKPPPPPSGQLDRLAISSVVAFVVMVVLSVVLGWIVAGRALRPLRTITTTARDISASNLHERLDLQGPNDEFKELGATLDELFGRLEASFESQRHFVANASHELRTPLTAERALLQVALADPDATVESMRATCDEVLMLGAQQERLIAALLTLASSEQGVERWEPLDLADIARGVVSARRAELERRGIHLDERLSDAPTTGDPLLVESLVANLFDNALHHNIEGGRVEIAATTVGGRPTIAVRNTGPVVPLGEIDRLFQPFQRLGDERVRHADGHGLGLAIVRAISDAHGAELVARPRPEGGLDIEVAFRA